MEMEKTMGVPKLEGSGTEQYLEEMQRIFAAREETYQKRKQEYEQKSQELQKIQTELGRQYQSLEGQKQELASAQQKLAEQKVAHREEQEELQREKQDFEQTKKLYEGQQQELLMKSRLELEQLRNERMEAEDLKREYEYQIGQQECGIPPSLPDLSAYVPKLEYEAVKQERDTLFQEKTQFQQTQCEELTQLREENQHLTIQLEQKELLLKQLGEERTSLLKKLLESKQESSQEPEKEREVLPEVETELDSAEVIPEEMDTAEENEWRQRPLRVSVKEQEITREELTATVLQRYLQNNHPEFEQLEIRHSEEGEQLHGEVGKLSYAFLFFEDLIQFDISAKRKGGKELEEKLERIGKKVPGVQFQYSKGEGRVYASGFLTKDLTPEQAMKQVFEIADYFRPIRDEALESGLLNPKNLGVNIKTLLYQVPGGMLSNLTSQLKEQGAEEKFYEVLEEVPRVRKDLGEPPLVTPSSQIVGTQAVFNVLMGERYKMATKETKDILAGKYGATVKPVDAQLQKKILGENAEIITCRPADLIKPQLADIEKEMAQYKQQDEDVLSYALFPQVATEFFKYREAQQQKVDASVADTESKAYPV